jgi:hypothetical protein
MIRTPHYQVGTLNSYLPPVAAILIGFDSVSEAEMQPQRLEDAKHHKEKTEEKSKLISRPGHPLCFVILRAFVSS